MKAALPLVKRLATASDYSSNKDPAVQFNPALVALSKKFMIYSIIEWKLFQNLDVCNFVAGFIFPITSDVSDINMHIGTLLSRYFNFIHICINTYIFVSFWFYLRYSILNSQIKVLMSFSKHHNIDNLISKLYFFDKFFFLTILVTMATIQNMICMKICEEKSVFVPFHKL